MRTNYIKCGDCLELLKTFSDNSIDVTFTSPPYNRKRNDTYDFYNDTVVDYYEMLIRFTDEALRVTKGNVIVNIQQNFYNKKDFYKYLGHYHKNICGMVVWCKSNPTPSSNANEETVSITNSVEYFIFLSKKGNTFRAYGKHSIKNYIETSINTEAISGHSAVMKKEVCEFFIKHFTRKGNIVLDPFCGCGTTGVVCAEHGRKFIGIEIVREYCDIAVKRIREVRNES